MDVCCHCDNSPSILFTRYNITCCFLYIVIAISGGITRLPIQVELEGIWLFCLCLIISYSAIYMLHQRYLGIRRDNLEWEKNSNIINHYLGPNWRVILSIAHLSILLEGILTYCLIITFDNASYVQPYDLTDYLLADHFCYRFVILIPLIAIAAKSVKLLFELSGPMLIVKFAAVVALAFYILPYWNLKNITHLFNFFPLICDPLLTILFTLFSILFLKKLTQVNITYQEIESGRFKATDWTIIFQRICSIILAISAMFLAFYFTFSLSNKQTTEAADNDISASVISVRIISGYSIKILTAMLNILAIVTAFFPINLAFQKLIKDILINTFSCFIHKEKINDRVMTICVALFIILLFLFWVMICSTILLSTQIDTPLYSIIFCLMTCYLFSNVTVLHKYKGLNIYHVLMMGVMLCLSPFYK